MSDFKFSTSRRTGDKVMSETSMEIETEIKQSAGNVIIFAIRILKINSLLNLCNLFLEVMNFLWFSKIT